MNKLTLMQKMKELQESLDIADFYMVEALAMKSDEEIDQMLQREIKHQISVDSTGRDTTEIKKRILTIQQFVEMQNCKRVLVMMDEDAESNEIGGVSLT